MICPRCGAFASDGTKTCPACHYKLEGEPKASSGDERWCESCGSPIPVGYDSCPVCGMPVEGAFKEDAEWASVVRPGTGEPEPASKAQGLVSAVPLSPKEGERPLDAGERPRHLRLVMLAAASALVLVGGTALFITRPWDPNAYSISATEEADTSMEGFPGEKEYLSSQDRVEDRERQELEAEASQRIQDLHQRLGELSDEADASYANLQDYLDSGYGDLSKVDVGAMTRASSELSQAIDALEAYDLTNEELTDQRERVVVIAGYLRDEAQLLSLAWSAAQQTSSPADAAFEVKSILAGDKTDHSYDDLHELFLNAYGAWNPGEAV